MKSRQRKKNLKGLLTNEEHTLLELYKKCDSVQFFSHNNDLLTACDFVNLTGTRAIEDSHQGTDWFKSRLGKIQATAFLKKENKQ